MFLIVDYSREIAAATTYPMKKQLLPLAFVLLCASVFAQKQQMFTLSGGYAWADVKASEYVAEDPDITGTGWRINGLYELNPNEGPLAFGLAVGFLSVSGDYTNTQNETATLTVNTIPAYFTIKYMFGQNNLRGFVKPAAGMQFADIEYDSPGETASSEDFGLYAGGGAGILYFIRDNIFINAEYELAWLTNSFYRDGLAQSVMGGVGMRF